MARFKNVDWELEKLSDGRIRTWEQAGMAVLMDIRDELQTLNTLLSCRSFVGIPQVLERIAANTEPLQTNKPSKKKRRG